jgi:hypothetical protein
MSSFYQYFVPNGTTGFPLCALWKRLGGLDTLEKARKYVELKSLLFGTSKSR